MGQGMVLTPAKQAERLKEDGNVYFKKERFAAAIDAYTEAIVLCPNVAVYWTNRALCHRKRNNWKKVEEDCLSAIKLDHNSFKAHYMLGLALLQRKEYTEGVKALERAMDLSRDVNPPGYMLEEIWQEIAKTKYLLWEKASTQRSWELQSLKESCENALKQKYFLDNNKKDRVSEEATALHAQQLDTLKEVFNKAAEDDIPTEIPDYLCCKISLDIFHDPVITPSGLTYEKAVILDHLQKVGRFDPITRVQLEPSQLIPNLAIKEAIQSYLQKHGWAYKAY
ncbi:E3 ubiquitin-protein ligase CHIP [Linum grandiflorum]